MSCRPHATAGRLRALFLVYLILSLSACAGRGPGIEQPWKFTTDGLEATTDAAAALADGSTQATKELLGPLKGMVSSMAPGGDGLVSDDVRVVAFVVANHERLQTDMARGGGEYVTAFAHLVRVPPDQRARTTGTLQAQYPSIFARDRSQYQSVDDLLTEYFHQDWDQVLQAPSF